MADSARKSAAKALSVLTTRREPARGSSMRSGGSVAESLAKLHANGGNHAVNAMLGDGFPLSPETRDEFERRFGADFSDVRIHNDGAAHASAAAMHANAYTFGRDIVFGVNRFVPQSSSGKHLLAHEIAHVVQQRRGGAAPALCSNATHEHGADAAASAFAGPARSPCRALPAWASRATRKKSPKPRPTHSSSSQKGG